MPTKDEVRQAIDDLEAAGAHVSPTTIRQQLGDRGSFRDIVLHYKQIASEAPRRQPTNGTHAATPPAQPVPAPPPAPEPLDETPGQAQDGLERLYALRSLALKRQAAHLAERERLTVQPFWEYAHDVPGHNRQVNAADKGAEHEGRQAAQYTYEINRWRVRGRA